MNRRNFLSTLIGGVAASAAVRTWPFRVYSFPREVKRIELTQWTGIDWYGTDCAFPGKQVIVTSSLFHDGNYFIVDEQKFQETLRKFSEHLTSNMYLYGRVAYTINRIPPVPFNLEFT